MFLLDSNICIYWLRGLPSVEERIVAHVEEIAVSSISYGEVMVGLSPGSADWNAAMVFFDMVDIAPFDRAAAEQYARLPFRRRGFDRLIAAHALALDATLVTNNPRDFADIPNLAVENWMESRP